MAGSEAEERIRAKAEEMLRLRWPDARIVHELQLEEGGVRIDLAAVDKDWLCVVEIKSEKDVLKRLPRQLGVATQVADEVWLAAHPKHEPAMAAMLREWGDTDARRDFRRALSNTRIFWDEGGAFLKPDDRALRVPPPWPDPRKQFQILWAAEMTRELAPHGGGHGTMSQKSRRAVEWLSGGQIRRSVCRQLRQRPFPRADDAIPFGDRNG